MRGGLLCSVGYATVAFILVVECDVHAVTCELEADRAADAGCTACYDRAGPAELVVCADNLRLGLFCDFGKELLDGLVSHLRARTAVGGRAGRHDRWRLVMRVVPGLR